MIDVHQCLTTGSLTADSSNICQRHCATRKQPQLAAPLPSCAHMMSQRRMACRASTQLLPNAGWVHRRDSLSMAVPPASSAVPSPPKLCRPRVQLSSMLFASVLVAHPLNAFHRSAPVLFRCLSLSRLAATLITGHTSVRWRRCPRCSWSSIFCIAV